MIEYLTIRLKSSFLSQKNEFKKKNKQTTQNN